MRDAGGPVSFEPAVSRAGAEPDSPDWRMCIWGGCARAPGLGFASPAIPQSLERVIFTLDFFLSALALGSVVICMILGHWYLIDPGMSVRHLKVMAAIFIAVVSARSLLGGYTS